MKNVFIHWADGLQPMQLNIVKKLNAHKSVRVFIVTLTEALRNQAQSIFGTTSVVSIPSDFSIYQSSATVLEILQEKGMLFGYAERSTNLVFHEHHDSSSLHFELIRRCAFVATVIEELSGIFIAEPCTDILSSLIPELSKSSSRVKALCITGAHLYSSSGGQTLFHLVDGTSQEPISINLRRTEFEELKSDEAYRYTKFLLENGFTSGNSYHSLPKEDGYEDFVLPEKKSKTTIFYPFQYYPESTTLGYSLGAADQLWIIQLLSRSLPPDGRLIVKKHFVKSPISANVDDYKDLPGVCVLPANFPAREIISYADIIACCTSTAGAESIILGKPVICFGNAFYKSNPLAVNLQIQNLSIRSLRQAITNVAHIRLSEDHLFAAAASVFEYFERVSKNCYIKSDDAIFPYSSRVAEVVESAVVDMLI